MPSDERITQALAVLSEARVSFTPSVAKSAEEVRGILERGQDAHENPQVRLAHELGPFAAGRIDLDRMAPFVGANEKLDERHKTLIDRLCRVEQGQNALRTKMDTLILEFRNK